MKNNTNTHSTQKMQTIEGWPWVCCWAWWLRKGGRPWGRPPLHSEWEWVLLGKSKSYWLYFPKLWERRKNGRRAERESKRKMGSGILVFYVASDHYKHNQPILLNWEVEREWLSSVAVSFPTRVKGLACANEQNHGWLMLYDYTLGCRLVGKWINLGSRNLWAELWARSDLNPRSGREGAP